MDNKVNFIWSAADILRGHYKKQEYSKIILPLTLIKRLDTVLADTKKEVLDFLPQISDMSDAGKEKALLLKTRVGYYNTSKFDFNTLKDDPDHLEENLKSYLEGFSSDARDILDKFKFVREINTLASANILYELIKHFNNLNLTGDPLEIGYMFEELIRKFADIVNENAGEYYTPREVINLLVNILFTNDHEVLTNPGIIRTIYDPTCGTGGMLSATQEYVNKLNSEAEVIFFGQELNPESYAIGKADLMIKGQDSNNIKLGNTLTHDLLEDEKFHYVLANPPYGSEWKAEKNAVKKEHEDLGFDGRYGAGLPNVDDGSMLFLQHMLSKMKPEGGRVGVVLNGSPLFNGDAGSGPSNIRKWIIENDWLEAIIALPPDMFYNTGISTYLWIISNDKDSERAGKVQLIDASSKHFFKAMKKSIGKKRKEIPENKIEEITKLYANFEQGEFSKIFDNEFFGYTKVTIDQPKLENGKPVFFKAGKNKGKPKHDGSLRDFERVPLTGDINSYLDKEVLPHLPNSYINWEENKVGYEINFTKYFYKYKPLRLSEEIAADLLKLEEESEALLSKIIY